MAVKLVRNVMSHAQKPHFFFRRNGRVHLNRWGASFQSTTGSRVVRISFSNAGYTMFRGSVKNTGYPLHSQVSPFTSPPVRHRGPSDLRTSSTAALVLAIALDWCGCLFPQSGGFTPQKRGHQLFLIKSMGG